MQYEHCAFQECTIYFNRPFINLTLDLGYFDLAWNCSIFRSFAPHRKLRLLTKGLAGGKIGNGSQIRARRS